jgi:hypothetical protein
LIEVVLGRESVKDVVVAVWSRKRYQKPVQLNRYSDYLRGVFIGNRHDILQMDCTKQVRGNEIAATMKKMPALRKPIRK